MTENKNFDDIMQEHHRKWAEIAQNLEDTHEKMRDAIPKIKDKSVVEYLIHKEHYDFHLNQQITNDIERIHKILGRLMK